MIKKLFQKKTKLFKSADNQIKYNAETDYWKEDVERYINWFNGVLKVYYKTNCPLEDQKMVAENIKDSAILTWHKLHQQVKYLADLKIDADEFKNKKLLDIGAGPMPSATCFEQADLYCLDPLFDEYLKAGFPIHYYGNVKFVHGYSERIPIADHFFDAIISVNALDHVDDFEKTALEIKRVLKEDGLVVFHLHFHPPTVTEPLELTEERVTKAFAGIKNFRKVSESNQKFGYTCAADEKYTLWSNIV